MRTASSQPALDRWRWDDYLLDYFGVNAAGSSAFSQFDFSRKQHQDSDVSYFNKPWFHMTTFMELNFRNAAQMHTMLFESSAHTLKISDDGLQKKAKELYNRQHSLLNTRARCAGLQGVSARLSWRKSSERNCLRNLLRSSLDDTLPGLDPQLEVYLRQFNAPNAALFLRTIEVSNVLALRKLALQHKLASSDRFFCANVSRNFSQSMGRNNPQVWSVLRAVLGHIALVRARPVLAQAVLLCHWCHGSGWCCTSGEGSRALSLVRRLPRGSARTTLGSYDMGAVSVAQLAELSDPRSASTRRLSCSRATHAIWSRLCMPA